MHTLAQVSRSLPGVDSAQRSTSPIPYPKNKEQVVGYAVGGVLLLVLIFGVVIWLKRRDE